MGKINGASGSTGRGKNNSVELLLLQEARQTLSALALHLRHADYVDVDHFWVV